MKPGDRIALATEATGLRGKTIYTGNLAGRLAKRGFRVALISPRDPFLDNAVEDEVERVRLPMVRSRPACVFALRALARSLAGDHVSVLHVCTVAHLRFWQALARRLGTALVASATSFVDRPVAYSSESGPRPLFVAISEDVRENLVNVAKIPKERVRLVPCGVEAPPLVEQGRNTENDIKVIATMGALEKEKGLETLLRAAQKLSERGERFQLLIMGDGPEEKRLRKLRAELGVNRHVVFASSTAAYGEILQDIDVFVLASAAQPLGQTMLQAMARGKPVVATGVGGVYSVIKDREEGLIVKFGDEGALVDALSRLLEDDQLRRTMGEAARRRVCDHFRIETMVDKTLDVYREAAGDG